MSISVYAEPASATAEAAALVQMEGVTMPVAEAIADGPDASPGIRIVLGASSGVRLDLSGSPHSEVPTWTRIG